MIHLSVKEIEEKVIEKYKESKRLNHILGVANLAKELAIKLGADSKKAYIAGLLHDYIKYETTEEMIEIIKDKEIIDKFRNSPQIYHAYASAKVAEKVFGINDIDILNAIKYHVYGRIDMSLLEEILVVSDYCEDSREYESCKVVRKILDSGNFYLALYLCNKNSIDNVLEKGYSPIKEQYTILEQIRKKVTKWNY